MVARRPRRDMRRDTLLRSIHRDDHIPISVIDPALLAADAALRQRNAPSKMVSVSINENWKIRVEAITVGAPSAGMNAGTYSNPGDASSAQWFIPHSRSNGSSSNPHTTPSELGDRSADSPAAPIHIEIPGVLDLRGSPTNSSSSPMSDFNNELSPLDGHNFRGNAPHNGYSSASAFSTTSSIPTHSVPDWLSGLPPHFKSDSNTIQYSQATTSHSTNPNSLYTGNLAPPRFDFGTGFAHQYPGTEPHRIVYGSDQYSEVPVDSMNHVNHPKNAAPTDLAFILNDTSISPEVGEKRKRSGVGDDLPVNPTKRRCHNVDPPPPLDASTITCGISNCGEVLPNERSTVAFHVNHIHTYNGSSNKSKILCKWINAWGQQCGTQVASNGLFRHVLDRHTSLLLKACPKCSKHFRKDSLSRHTMKCRGGVRNPSALSNEIVPV